MTQTVSLLDKVVKRDGTVVDFDRDRIVRAIHLAMNAVSEGGPEAAEQITNEVIEELENIKYKHRNFVPNVEGIQDSVEKILLKYYYKTGRAYVVYREKRASLRQQQRVVPDQVKQLADESRKYFRSPLCEFVYLRTYARWIDQEERRETWIETVNRYMNFMQENLGDRLNNKEYQQIRDAILRQDIMPSMRLMQFAGTPARKTNVCGYNCSYIAPRTLQDFGEVMYLSMCGTGVGFSVEGQNVHALPQIQPQSGKMRPMHIIEDSKEGWCDALVLGLQTWFAGEDITFNYSKLRPAGARLKTFGGKSSGPEPLRSLLQFARNKIIQKQRHHLTTIDVHDILCKIGEVVVSGGVRRSAMISLSDLDDAALRDAKKGPFYLSEPQRTMANNSAVYNEKPDLTTFLDEWLALMKSGSGERGIFNRGSLFETLPTRRLELFQSLGLATEDRIVGQIGTNPCGEIILQSKQFCNLTEVIARADDNEKSLLEKMRLATILGTYQASLTNFPYLSQEWKNNCEQERLLGVSISGHWDCSKVREAKILERMKHISIDVNIEYAKRFGINPSTSITCVKPSGTVSQVVDCASGMHPRHSPYYIRRIRISATDALFKMLKKQGVPYHPEVGQSEKDATTFVLEFPVKAPDGAVCRDNLSALQQLEHWKCLKENYTEHNPSVTISVGEEEWLEVAHWVYKNWNMVGGLSFLPRFDHVYQLAPYETITKEQYETLLKNFVHVDSSQLMAFEVGDETELQKELACAGGVCEIV